MATELKLPKPLKISKSFKRIYVLALDEEDSMKILGFISCPKFSKNDVTKAHINPLKYIYHHGVWRLERGKNLSAQFHFNSNEDTSGRNFCPQESFRLASMCIKSGFNWKARADCLVKFFNRVSIEDKLNNYYYNNLVYFSLHALFAARIVYNGYDLKEKSFEEIRNFLEENKEIIPFTSNEFIDKYSEKDFLVVAANLSIVCCYYLS